MSGKRCILYHHEGHEEHEALYCNLFLRELRVLRGLKTRQNNIDDLLDIRQIALFLQPEFPVLGTFLGQ